MSLLDMDEQFAELCELVEFDRTPFTDIKQIGKCDLGIIEGGVCNAENVEVLKSFRKSCKHLVAIGACAINGGVPAMRNQFRLGECLEESYLYGMGVEDASIPNDPELPLLLNQVHPIHEVVKVDFSLPGCPPPADTIWTFFQQILAGKTPTFDYTQIHYD